VGKKGVLWWSIYKILFQKKEKAPKYLLLENVDRLLKSPDNHTEGAIDSKRAFLMGNALVVGIVERIAKKLLEEI